MKNGLYHSKLDESAIEKIITKNQLITRATLLANVVVFQILYKTSAHISKTVDYCYCHFYYHIWNFYDYFQNVSQEIRLLLWVKESKITYDLRKILAIAYHLTMLSLLNHLTHSWTIKFIQICCVSRVDFGWMIQWAIGLCVSDVVCVSVYLCACVFKSNQCEPNHVAPK